MHVDLGTLVTMATMGVAATVGEKLLNSMGKPDMASFCNIAGLSGLGLMALKGIGQLLQNIRGLS